jgi:DNA-binding response OmpR family regulator
MYTAVLTTAATIKCVDLGLCRASPVRKKHMPNGSAGGPVRLALLVSPDPVMRRFCHEALNESGFTVANGIESGADAMVRARELRPNVILLSQQLSDVPVGQAIRWLRCNAESAMTPIIVLNGKADDGVNESGVTILARPISAKALRTAALKAVGAV